MLYNNLERGWLQSHQSKLIPKGCFSLILQEPQAGIGFPHLGTGTGMSPSLSPSISLRASAFADERGKKECVSQSGQHVSRPALGDAHLHFV